VFGLATVTLDAKGLSCPQPVLKIAAKSATMAVGDLLEVEADCSTFPDDVKKWCDRAGKVLIVCTSDANGSHKAQIQF